MLYSYNYFAYMLHGYNVIVSYDIPIVHVCFNMFNAVMIQLRIISMATMIMLIEMNINAIACVMIGERLLITT